MILIMAIMMRAYAVAIRNIPNRSRSEMVPDAPVRVPEMQDTPPCRAQRKAPLYAGLFYCSWASIHSRSSSYPILLSATSKKMFANCSCV